MLLLPSQLFWSVYYNLILNTGNPYLGKLSNFCISVKVNFISHRKTYLLFVASLLIATYEIIT